MKHNNFTPEKNLMSSGHKLPERVEVNTPTDQDITKTHLEDVLPVQDPRPVKPSKVKIIASSLNVRKGPGKEFPVISRLSKNDVVDVVTEESENDWLLITIDDNLGYVLKAFTESIE